MSSKTGQLTEPAHLVARLVAASKVDDVHAAFEKLDGDSPDALHDLRVALRRLRSWVRAYRPKLDDTLRKKTRRRLDDLASTTDAARDAEVAVEWIEKQQELPTFARPGVDYIAAIVAKRRSESTRSARAALNRRLPRTLDQLTADLRGYWRRVDASAGRAKDVMAVVTAELIRHHHRQLCRRLARIETADDNAALHRARIATKRLRYLLEWLREFPDVGAVCDQLSELQDILGTCHDMHVLTARFVDELARVGAADAARRAKQKLEIPGDDNQSFPPLVRVRRGIVDLATRARREHLEAFQKFQTVWTPETLESVTRVVESLATELEAMPSI